MFWIRIVSIIGKTTKSYFFFFINQSLFEAMTNFSGGDTAMRSSLEEKGKSLV